MAIGTLALAQNPMTEQRLLSANKLEQSADDMKAMLDSNIITADSIMNLNDSLYIDSIYNAPVVVRDLEEILSSLPDTMPEPPFNPIIGPWVFSGYRNQKERSFDNLIGDLNVNINKVKDTSWNNIPYTPEWLHDALTQARISEDCMYNFMIYNPESIQFTYWDLPVPPRLPEDDVTLATYIKNLNLPEVTIADALLPEFEQKKKHWLHKFNTGLQFSQAYLSKNWYQGGNNYLQLLYNFYWNVQLNPTYHPNEIFESTVSYKLGINSVEQSDVNRKYSLSEDNFQYNVK